VRADVVFTKFGTINHIWKVKSLAGSVDPIWAHGITTSSHLRHSVCF